VEREPEKKTDRKEQSTTTIVSSILLYNILLPYVSPFIGVLHEEYIKYLQK
jgi:hypothetical protein